MPDRSRERGDPDPLGRVLEAGLVAVVVLAPFPFGAVVPAGRLSLEIAAFFLLAVWLARGLVRPAPLPGRACCLGLVGLLILCLGQDLPVGATTAPWLSPLSVETRRRLEPSGDARDAERRLLGMEPNRLDAPWTVSLDPRATASALRTGAALGALLLVASTVAAARGPGILALALLVSAAFQGLYGTLVLASGHPKIWHVAKKYYLDCATGTFVNRNHFAGFLAATLPCGLALMVHGARRLPPASTLRERVLSMFGPEGSRTLLLGLLLAAGLAGLMLSFSRAGIGLGLGALLLTAGSLGRRGLHRRVLAIALLLAVAAVPLAQIGAERLAARYARSAEDLGGRLTVWEDTLRMARASPLIGVGFGSFDAAYPLFRSPQVRAHFDHAHNDALQAVAEGGFIGVLFLALLLGPVFGQIVRSLSGSRGTLAPGFAAGLTALLLHGLVDFNFHIPSNAATAAILAGVLLGIPWNERT